MSLQAYSVGLGHFLFVNDFGCEPGKGELASSGSCS